MIGIFREFNAMNILCGIIFSYDDGEGQGICDDGCRLDTPSIAAVQYPAI